MAREALRLVVATGNPGKVREFATLLDGLDLELVALSEFPGMPEVAETGSSYLDNARIKARAAARHTGLPALADDSGLEVDALGGRPGVRSARFAADNDRGDGDADNTALLLERLVDTPEHERGASFRCVIVVATPDDRELRGEGTCAGKIAHEPSGAAGFGYDPVFHFPAKRATFAEISPAEKQTVSHRAAACADILPRLKAFLIKLSPL